MERRKRPVLRILISIVAILLVLVLAVAVAFFIFADRMLDKLDRTEITGNENLAEEEIYEEPTVDVTDSVEEIKQAEEEFQQIQNIELPKKANVSNILLIGSDRRSKNENGRSDSMMLVSVNYDTGNIHLTSFSRAMYVCIPKSKGDTWSMLNASYSWGGPKLLIDTIERNFRLEIDHYVVVDFQSFMKAVDILGGVELDLTPAEARYLTAHWEAPTSSGRQLLDGQRALGLARSRMIDNDFKRTERQRRILTALMKKAMDSDLESLMELANEILPLVNTDLTNTDIFTYAVKVLPMLKNPITQRMLPIENEEGKSFTGRIYVKGREMYKVDFEENIKALHAFICS